MNDFEAHGQADRFFKAVDQRWVRLGFYLFFTVLVFVNIVMLQNTASANRHRALRNCHRIELVKSYIRQTLAFDEAATKRRLIRDGIDPESSAGLLAIQQAKQYSSVLQQRFMATPC